MRRFAEFIVDHPRPIQIGVLVVTLVAAVFAAQLKFDFSPQSVYEGQDELLAFAEQHKNTFGHEDAIIVAVIEATGAEDVLSPRSLKWQQELAGRVRAIDRVERVNAVATLRKPRLRSTVLVVPEGGEISEFDEGRIREWVGDQELVLDTLISRDFRLTSMLIEFDPGAREMEETEEIVGAIRTTLEDCPPPDGFRTSLTGISALRVNVVENLMSDQMVMFPLSGSLFLLVVVLMFRNIRITLYALGAVFAGVIWAFGIVSAMGGSFNLLSNSVPTLTLIIGAANVVHLVSRFLDELPHHANRQDAARATMIEMTVTCLLTFATTAIGFGSLLISSSVILRQFATQASIGLVCQYFTVTMLLGSALGPCASLTPDTNKTHWWTNWPIRQAARIVRSRPPVVMIFSLLVVAGCAISARRLAVNSYIFETYDQSHPAMRVISLLDDKMSGLSPLEINLRASDKTQLFEPATFEQLIDLEASLLDKPEIRYARSYVDLHLVAGRAKRELTLENIERMQTNVLRARELSRREFFISDDDLNARVLLRVKDVGSARMNKLIDEIDGRLQMVFPPGDGITATVTGEAFLHARCMDQFVRDMFYSLLTASIAIFAVISLLFRSLRTGLISAIPNMTPLVLTLGYIAFRGYPLTAGTVIVFGITLGIAVDDTIHFLSRFREERTKGGSIEDAIGAVFDSSGRAIVLTTVLIVSGLSVLLLSAFVPTRRFAELTAVTMAAALLGDLLLLPACLLVFGRADTDEDREEPEVEAQAG